LQSTTLFRSFEHVRLHCAASRPPRLPLALVEWVAVEEPPAPPADGRYESEQEARRTAAAMATVAATTAVG